MIPVSVIANRAGGYVTWAVLAGCGLMWIVELWYGAHFNQIINSGGVTPAWLLHREPRPSEYDFVPVELTPLTAVLLHADILHLGFNCLWLGVFGPPLEATLGHVRYALLLLISAYAAVLFQALALPSAAPVIGASGVIAGVLGAYAALQPKTLVRVCLVIPPRMLAVPAVFVLAGWFALDLLHTLDEMQRRAVSYVGHPAHLSGFLFGIGLAATLRPAGMALFDSDKRWPTLADLQRAQRSDPSTKRFWDRIYAVTKLVAIVLMTGITGVVLLGIAVTIARR
jgi:membrane associated rhomboid family serine protease